MRKVLLIATTTGYQTRAFGEAAERLGIDIALATDRCKTLDDPWRDRAIPVRFYDEEASVAAIVREAWRGARGCRAWALLSPAGRRLRRPQQAPDA